jgi:hypothetical protein
LLQDASDSAESAAKAAIAKAERVVIGCDGWKNPRGERVFAFVALLPRPVFMKVLVFHDERETGLFLAGKISEVFEEAGSAKVVGLVTDNCSVMTNARLKATESFRGVFAYGCFSHHLHNFCKDVLNSVSPAKDCLEMAKKVVKFFKRHAIAGDVLRQMQEKYCLTRDLTQPCETRWGSAQLCLRRLKDNKSAVVAAMMDSRLDSDKKTSAIREICTSKVFWDHVVFLDRFLEPAVHGIDLSQGDAPAFCKMLPCLMTVRLAILRASYPAEMEATGMKKVVAAAWCRRFALAASPELIAAHYLNVASDPVTEDDRVIEKDIATFYDRVILEYICRCASRFLHDHPCAVDSAAAQWAQFRAHAGPFAPDVLWGAAMRKDAVSWWQGGLKGQNVDELSHLALVLLQLPASTGAVERSFKAFKSVFDYPRRTRLGQSRAESLVRVTLDCKLSKGKLNTSQVGDSLMLSSPGSEAAAKRVADTCTGSSGTNTTGLGAEGQDDEETSKRDDDGADESDSDSDCEDFQIEDEDDSEEAEAHDSQTLVAMPPCL